jgi:hypothetical protein
VDTIVTDSFYRPPQICAGQSAVRAVACNWLMDLQASTYEMLTGQNTENIPLPPLRVNQ